MLYIPTPYCLYQKQFLTKNHFKHDYRGKRSNIVAIENKLSERKGNAPTNSIQRIEEGDVLTFAVPDGLTVDSLIVYHPETVSNGRTIKEYIAVRTADGREVSQRQLVGSRNNGLNVEGDTPDERLTNFLLEIAESEGQTLQVTVAKVRVLPPTRSDWAPQRIFTWQR